MKFFLLSSLVAVMGTAFLTQSDLPGAVKGHVTLLTEAKSLKATFSVNKLGGGLEKGSIVYSKVGMFKIDMPTKMVESDGKMVWTLDKVANTYTEMPASLAATKEPAVWAWAAFFSADALKGTKEYAAKEARVIRGASVTEFTGKLANDKPFSLYIDTKTGVARGANIADSLILAQGDIVVGKDALDAKDFAFVAPAGAKKIEAPVASAATYAQVEKILKANCLPCHSAGGRKAGLSVDSYDGVMAKVTPGNAAGSGLFRSVSGPRPSMPKNGAPLSKADLEILEGWINSGAKNQ